MVFIPELTTRVNVEMDTSELDNAINLIESDEILSQLGLAEELTRVKSKLTGIKDPLTEAVAGRLQSNQEMIISSKHHKSGMMAQSVDLMNDGDDILVGNTAESVDGFPYPLAIEKGSRDHYIAPVTFDALHWTDGGNEYWSKGHMVSGIKPDPFVDPSIQNTLWDLEKIWDSITGDL